MSFMVLFNRQIKTAKERSYFFITMIITRRKAYINTFFKTARSPPLFMVESHINHNN